MMSGQCYTLDVKPQCIVVGLGNPGASYEQTRHNAGFLALDAIADAGGSGEWSTDRHSAALSREVTVGDVPVLLVKPQTFMNLSGEAVLPLLQYFKLDPSKSLLVLCDDVDVALGTLRLRTDGGPGTHNGLRSIVDTIGEGFARIRIGVGPTPSGSDLAAWVLQPWTTHERKILTTALEKIPALVSSFILEEGNRQNVTLQAE